MKELTVIYRGFGQSIPVGTLAQDGRVIIFEYSAQALAAQLHLSPVKAPLRQAAYPTNPGEYGDMQGVPGFIYDSLPDGWGHRIMDRRLKARGLDPATLTALDRLAYLGENTMGALVYLPSQEEIESDKDWTLLDVASEIQAIQDDDGHKVLAEMARVGGSPGGARPKAQMFFNKTTGALSSQASQAPGGDAWLVKFAASDDAPDSCVLEELYARIAGVCHLGMSDTHLFELPRNKFAFGTRRFDRRGSARVHIHSLAGILHANFRVPSVSYGDFLRVTRRLTLDQREVVKAFKICVFNVLMNNRDDHAKNLAFMREDDGRWLLAPPYDLTYCSGVGGEHFMDIASEGRTPGRKHLLATAAAAGLEAKVAAPVLDEMLDQVTPAVVKKQANEMPLKAATVTTVVKAVTAHHARLRSP